MNHSSVIKSERNLILWSQSSEVCDIWFESMRVHKHLSQFGTVWRVACHWQMCGNILKIFLSLKCSMNYRFITKWVRIPACIHSVNHSPILNAYVCQTPFLPGSKETGRESITRRADEASSLRRKSWIGVVESRMLTTEPCSWCGRGP